MNLIQSNLSVNNILLDFQASSKKRALEQLAQVFENNYGIPRSIVFDSLFARERLGSTAIGHGVAIPHGRIPKLTETCTAFIRLQQAIPYDAPNGENVRLLVCILVPESATQEHLDLLAAFVKKLSDEKILQQLNTENSPDEILKLLTSDT